MRTPTRLFTVLWLLMPATWFACGSTASAQEPPNRPTVPPVIDVVNFGVGKPTSRDTDTAHRHAEPADGPMCTTPPPSGEVPTLAGLLLLDPATEQERRDVQKVIAGCSHLRGPVELVVDPFYVLSLLRLEADLGAPRGLFAATACVESSLKPRGKHAGRFYGDFVNGEPLASGPLQLHRNVWLSCGGTPDDPHDVLWAAGCYWSAVRRAAAKAAVVSGCRERDLLRVGEAAAANIRRYGWRCNSKSAHWRVMEMMKLK